MAVHQDATGWNDAEQIDALIEPTAGATGVGLWQEFKKQLVNLAG